MNIHLNTRLSQYQPKSDNSVLGYRIYGFLIIAVLSFIPVYIFPSGGAQVVDLPIVLIFIAVVLSGSNLRIPSFSGTLRLFIFVTWTSVINICYFLYYDFDLSFILSSAAVIQGLILFYSFYTLFVYIPYNRGIKYLYIGILLSIILCCTIKGNYEAGSRNALSFNNANQLGYFSVILISYIVLTIKHKVKNKLYLVLDIIIILASHFFLLMSLSRGAFLAVLVIDAFFIFNLRKMKYFVPIGSAILVIMAFILFINPTFIKKQLTGRQKSAYNLSAIDSAIEVRLFRRLGDLEGWQLLIGRGAGGSARYVKSNFVAMEVHNIFGDIFRSYGVIGLGLFCWWLFQLIMRTRIVTGASCVWLALLIYNFSHNGIRFRSFWILLAFMAALSQYYIKNNKALLKNND